MWYSLNKYWAFYEIGSIWKSMLENKLERNIWEPHYQPNSTKLFRDFSRASLYTKHDSEGHKISCFVCYQRLGRNVVLKVNIVWHNVFLNYLTSLFQQISDSCIFYFVYFGIIWRLKENKKFVRYCWRVGLPKGQHEQNKQYFRNISQFSSSILSTYMRHYK